MTVHGGGLILDESTRSTTFAIRREKLPFSSFREIQPAAVRLGGGVALSVTVHGGHSTQIDFCP